MKDFRRCATRYEKRATTWRGMLQAAHVVISLKLAI
jgi:transposase